MLGAHLPTLLGRAGFARKRKRDGVGYFRHQMEIRCAASKALARLRSRTILPSVQSGPYASTHK